MPVARAYLEHHVVLAELLHELLAVAHVPAQICEDGWGKRSARGSRVDRRDGSRLLSPGVPFCRAWKSFASIASLSWMVFRADIVACVPLHACDAREVSGEWARLPQEKAALVNQRGEHLISKFLSVVISRQCGEQTKRQLSPPSHTRLRGLRSRARARVGACSTPSTCSRPRARWVRYGYAAPGRRASRPRRARVSPSPLPFPFSTLLRPSASDASPAPRVRRSWRTSRAARLA